MDPGTGIPGKIQFSTLDIMMSTYNSASLNQSHPETGRHASYWLRTEHCEARTGSNHHHYLKMFSFFFFYYISFCFFSKILFFTIELLENIYNLPLIKYNSS